MVTTKVKLKETNFPELPFFLGIAIFFLDIGILFGALNSLRVAGIFQVPEIHQTHWTSTVFGAITLLMLGQSYFIFSQLNQKKDEFHRGTLLVLVVYLIAILSSYLSVWLANSDLAQIFAVMFVYGVKVGSVLFLLLVLSFFREQKFRETVKEHPSVYLILSGVIWLVIASVVFFSTRQYLNDLFRDSYIYGFFSLILFGTLSFVLPILYDQKPKSRGSVQRDLVLFNLAAIIFVLGAFLEENNPFFLAILGPFVWGLAGFMFILWVFDLIYKAGIQASLLGLMVALMMFGFFVFDTFMLNVFPQWVLTSHIHFMFIGTLILTIISIGMRLIITQYDPTSKSVNELPGSNETGGSNLLRLVSMVIAVISVGGILLSFTLESFVDRSVAFLSASIFGFALFVSMIFVELVLLRNLVNRQ